MNKKNVFVVKKISEETKMKTKLSRLFMVLMLMVTVMGLVACGNESEENGSKSEVEGPTAEEDVVVKIDGVEIPLDSTFEELVAICEENDWEVDEKLYPDTSGWDTKPYNQDGSITTPDGEIRVATMANEENNGSVIESISIRPFYYEGSASILGVTVNTDLDDIEEKFEGEKDGEYIFYTVDDYVSLKVHPDTHEGKNTVTIVSLDCKSKSAIKMKKTIKK